jgi:hypothetical protein
MELSWIGGAFDLFGHFELVRCISFGASFFFSLNLIHYIYPFVLELVFTGLHSRDGLNDFVTDWLTLAIRHDVNIKRKPSTVSSTPLWKYVKSLPF